jgi:hypothetical protein
MLEHDSPWVHRTGGGAILLDIIFVKDILLLSIEFTLTYCHHPKLNRSAIVELGHGQG